MNSEDIQLPVEEGLCKDCKWRFRRVFIPSDPESYVDEDGDKVLESFDDESGSLEINFCLLMDMDINADVTLECNHYKKKSSDSDISIFRHKIK